MRSRIVLTYLLVVISSGLLSQQVATDSLQLTIDKQLQEVEVLQKRSSNFVDIRDNLMVVDMAQIKNMPKFLGTSDPVRYLQSLSGIATNNETRAGLHIQGCDDYQSLVSINQAAVLYPNHLLGLFSTFVPQHFSSMRVEQSEHEATMVNRVGGYVNLETQQHIPQRFGFEGNMGVINSDLTMSIPMGKRQALFLTARASYLNL